MIKKWILAAACCLPIGLLAQKGFVIHGKVGMLDAPATAYLSYRHGDSVVNDSAVIHGGNFTFRGQLAEPAQAYLIVKHDTITRSRFARQDELVFYVDNADITVTATDSVARAIIKGSVTQDESMVLSEWQRPYRRIADSIKGVYLARTPEERKDSAWLQAVRPRMRLSIEGIDTVSRAFIAAYPHSYISLLTFRQVELAYNFNPDSAAARFARFPESQRESVMGKKLQEMINTSRKTNAGETAMDFTQNDSTGKPVKLSRFRGQYVLLDFWASWCKPCRAENPNYLKAYNKFKDRNFTILGVSLDDERTRRAWLKAVRVDGMPWTQVSELKGFQSKAAVMYGVEAIPSNFLINPDGKIIARNLRGEELGKKLDTLFSKQYTLSGRIFRLNAPARIYLSYGQGADAVNDSTDIGKNGEFRFTGSVHSPVEAVLTVKHGIPSLGKIRQDNLVFFLENSRISILATDSIKNAVVKGSVADREYHEIMAAITPLTNTIIHLLNEYHGKPKDSAYTRAADSVTQLVADIKNLRLQFVKAHLNSFMGLYTFYYFILDSKFVADSVEPLYDQFSADMKNSGLGQLVVQKMDIGRRRQTGVAVTDFTQTDLDGKPFMLSSLRGKYVLVDFWASWCVPCRAENPNLREAYKRLKSEDKNFEVVGVSLDQSRAAWAEAVKHDSLPWIHVCDLQGWKNAVALMYGIQSVPQNLLVNPQGVIIAKNLRGEDLYQKLSAFIN